MPELFVCQNADMRGKKPFKCTTTQLLKNGNKCPKCEAVVNPTTLVEEVA